MAEEEKKEEEKKEGTEVEAPKKSRKKFIIIIALALLVLGGGGAGAYIFLLKGDPPAEEGSVDGEDGAEGADDEVLDGEIEVLALEPFIVNLMNTSGSRYLKITINLELPASVKKEMELKKAQVRDSIIILLSSKDYSDISSVPGKYQLRDEVGARVNLILTEGKVKSVYFTEFVIQ